MKKGDLIIILTALVFAGAFYFGYKLFTDDSGARVVKITVDQTVVKEIKINEDTDIKYLVKTKDGEFIDISVTDKMTLPEDEFDYNLVYIHDHGVEVIDADCPAKVDVKQGFVDTLNFPIVCIPHKLSVVIESTGDEDNSHDAIG